MGCTDEMELLSAARPAEAMYASSSLEVGGSMEYQGDDTVPAYSTHPGIGKSSDTHGLPLPQVFPLTVSFCQLPASGKVNVLLYPFSGAIWATKDPKSGNDRMSLDAPQGSVLPLRSLVINSRQFSLETSDACQELRLLIYVASNEPLLQGYVDLPSGSYMTLESELDRTNVIGRGSFALIIGG